MISTKLRPLEFRVWRRLRELQLPQRWLVAVSGGVDSLALLECLARVAPRLGVNLEIATVHHGRAQSAAVFKARARAFAMVKRVTGRRGLVFHGIRRDLRLKELRSEQDLRDYRHQALAELARAREISLCVFAHHADDLFETRLIRLVRGTGAQGLEAMRLQGDGILRPFLEEWRADILKYATDCGLEWHEDPTNGESGPLRNWIRREWLAALEEKRPGASLAFARSLQNIVDEIEMIPRDTRVHSAEEKMEFRIDLRRYSGLTPQEQCRALARELREAGIRDFTSAQIREIQKRIFPKDVRRSTFLLLDFLWRYNAGQIQVSRAPRSRGIDDAT